MNDERTVTVASQIKEKNPYHSTSTKPDIYVLTITAEGSEKDLEYLRDIILEIEEEIK